MSKRNFDGVIIGGQKDRQGNAKEPKMKWRVLIQKRRTPTSDFEEMRSFMIYDFIGMKTTDKIVKRLKRLFK